MECKCPSCSSALVKKNGHIHNGKQNHRCLACQRQFVLESDQKIIDDHTKALIRKTLLERVSLEGVCRIFDIYSDLNYKFHQLVDRIEDA